MPNVDPAKFPSRIEILRAGTHVDASGREYVFTRDDIAQMASSYDPKLSEAPIVVGHPKMHDVAYGWAKALHAEGDSLWAEPHQVEAQFAEMVEEGRFKTRSASVFLPTSKGNPTPGKYYLRHIGYLGATPPAVKGLREAQFASGETEFAEFSSTDMSVRWSLSTVRRMFGRLRDWLVETAGAERAQQVISDYELEQLSNDVAALNAEASASAAFSEAVPATPLIKEPSVPDIAANFAEREAELVKREERIAAEERRIKEAAAAAARDDAANFAEQLIKEGRLKPAHKAQVVELLISLPEAPLNFAEADGGPRAGGDVLRDLLRDRPPFIQFGERSAPAGGNAGHADFAAPAGALISGDRLELHRKATAYQAAHPNTPYLTAVAAVGG